MDGGDSMMVKINMQPPRAVRGIQALLAALVLAALAACGGGQASDNHEPALSGGVKVVALTNVSDGTRQAVAATTASESSGTVAYVDLNHGALSQEEMESALKRYATVVVQKRSAGLAADDVYLPGDVDGARVMAFSSQADGAVSLSVLQGDIEGERLTAFLEAASIAATQQAALESRSEAAGWGDRKQALIGPPGPQLEWIHTGKDIFVDHYGEIYEFTVDKIESQQMRCPCNNRSQRCQFQISTNREMSTTHSINLGGSPEFGEAQAKRSILGFASYTFSQTESVSAGSALTVSLNRGDLGTPAMKQTKRWKSGRYVDRYECKGSQGSYREEPCANFGARRSRTSTWDGWMPMSSPYKTVTIRKLSCG
jgi:hypothetical protein